MNKTNSLSQLPAKLEHFCLLDTALTFDFFLTTKGYFVDRLTYIFFRIVITRGIFWYNFDNYRKLLPRSGDIVIKIPRRSGDIVSASLDDRLYLTPTFGECRRRKQSGARLGLSPIMDSVKARVRSLKTHLRKLNSQPCIT